MSGSKPLRTVSLEKKQQAIDYLAKNRVHELLNDLCASVCFHKPSNVKEFLVEELRKRSTQGAEAGLFDNREIDAVFSMADVMQKGIVSEIVCRDALRSLANSKYQFDEVANLQIPAEVDSQTFRKTARSLLAMSPVPP
mmetsp:Transcript_28172/g.62138  ORF Transcript_28172/g.62138 Transcript_28172/m.62138 type:complete len:139 (+) Transcript_28172:42-458(+)|eukprot:CAMPEP_0204276806 /NCGR_PEP_ID=MMETSP0468-20130131/28920_1 /ASSEMBLY_ACC=CAM_ASM_000383 /TAXON_ID=2969 /ORGANISM="Oxyrrhis marina" /LENGTH=138 /DNA_ID=CAMNT_0051253507 /DNA_START=35 /DNA_END=454 /DNA_ORIENTATION=+